jgi:hypothetical protein
MEIITQTDKQIICEVPAFAGLTIWVGKGRFQPPLESN